LLLPSQDLEKRIKFFTCFHDTKPKFFENILHENIKN